MSAEPLTPAAVEPSADPVRRKIWSAKILDGGFTQLPTLLLWGQGRLGLTSEELNVLVQLLSHRWTSDKDPHPGKAAIATRMGVHARTVQRHITSLEDKGFIKRVHRTRVTKGQDTNGYDVSGLMAKLEALAPEFKKVRDTTKRRQAAVEGAK